MADGSPPPVASNVFTVLGQLQDESSDITKGLPQSVKAVLISKDNKVLLMRRPGERGWDLPGGGVDKGESLADAYLRELDEEAGISTDNAMPLYGFLRDTPGKKKKYIHYVAAKLDKKAAKTKIKLSAEHDHYAFFSWEDIETLTFMPSYKKALDIALTLMRAN